MQCRKTAWYVKHLQVGHLLGISLSCYLLTFHMWHHKLLKMNEILFLFFASFFFFKAMDGWKAGIFTNQISDFWLPYIWIFSQNLKSLFVSKKFILFWKLDLLSQTGTQTMKHYSNEQCTLKIPSHHLPINDVLPYYLPEKDQLGRWMWVWCSNFQNQFRYKFLVCPWASYLCWVSQRCSAGLSLGHYSSLWKDLQNFLLLHKECEFSTIHM